MRNGKAEKKVLVVLYGLALILLPGLVYPEIPKQINYQGYLTSAQGVPVNENVQMVFALYDALSGGTKLWEETHNVNVTRGVYNVILGEGTPSNPVNLPFDIPYYLSVRVGSDPEMDPRVPLSSMAYAFRAQNAENGGGWTYASGNISLQTGTDKVGIGTTNPAENLEIKSLSSAFVGIDHGTGSYGGMSFKEAGVTQWFFPFITTTDDILVVRDELNHKSVMTILPDTGYVGIDTVTPTAKLDVNGQMRVNSRLVFTNPAGTPYQDNWIGMANNIDGATKWLHVGGITEGGIRRLAFDGDLAYLSGSAGVNQKNPSERLEIAGNVKMSGAGNGLIFPDGTKQTTEGVMGFPNPDFDSGWLSISPGQEWGLGHPVGGDIDKYVVDLEFMQDSSTLGIHNRGFGSDSSRSWTAPCGTGPLQISGGYYKNLTPGSITVVRNGEDSAIYQFRVKIWTYE